MICIYEANETDWHGNGLCILQPSSCTVTEIAGGDFSLTLVHPITEDLRWKELQEERIIKAPVPAYRPLEDDGTVIKYTQSIQIEARSIIEQRIISRRGCSLGLLIRSIMSNAALVPISGVGKAMVVSGG